jgi:hypothetical protein
MKPFTAKGNRENNLAKRKAKCSFLKRKKQMALKNLAVFGGREIKRFLPFLDLSKKL